MFDPAVIAIKQRRLEVTVLADFPQGLVRPSVAEARSVSAYLMDLWDPETQTTTRPLRPDEARWVQQAQLLSAIDFRFWAERWAMVNKGGERLEPLFPLWVSQELVLGKLAEIERTQQHGYQDGCLVTTLKARQLGVSTLTQCLLTHRVTTRPHTRSLTASDEADTTGYLFEMSDRILQHLPWFLKPAETKGVRAGERRILAWDTGSEMRSQPGKSMRGQNVEESGESRGQIGRGFTFSAVHLSELSSWESPEQIDGSLFPGIPISPRVVGVLESTAKGRHNWWHKQWLRATEHDHRFRPVFIPWYAEPDKWRLKPPSGWLPSTATLAHAAQAAVEGPKWLGTAVSLTADQLYWYERGRADAEREGTLATFLSEYPALPEESFQFSGRSIFSLETRERVKAQARPLAAVWSIEPAALQQATAELLRQAAK